MNKVAVDFENSDIGSVFIYTHEAHPGENYPHLTSMDQKFRHAEALRDVYGVTRRILLDALNGALPVYKSDWSDSHSVRNALEYYLEIPNRRKAGERLAPFHVERLDYRNQERELFYESLERNGPKAVAEFQKAFPSG